MRMKIKRNKFYKKKIENKKEKFEWGKRHVLGRKVFLVFKFNKNFLFYFFTIFYFHSNRKQILNLLHSKPVVSLVKRFNLSIGSPCFGDFNVILDYYLL